MVLSSSLFCHFSSLLVTGGAGSHWEDRLVPPEYMTGIASSQDQVVSGLTLALFEGNLVTLILTKLILY